MEKRCWSPLSRSLDMTRVQLEIKGMRNIKAVSNQPISASRPLAVQHYWAQKFCWQRLYGLKNGSLTKTQSNHTYHVCLLYQLLTVFTHVLQNLIGCIVTCATGWLGSHSQGIDQGLHRKNSFNRPFSKMAATDLNELKLNWMKNWYQRWKEHLYFSNLANFQRIRCYISLGNVRWNLTNPQSYKRL